MRPPLTPWLAFRATTLALVTAVLIGLGGAGPATTVAGGVVVVSHGSRATPRVAITFDDGVSPANCRRILAILAEHGVPATFFPIADAMRADPAFWRLVVAEGDPIGDHTLTHPEMPSLTEAQQLGQIEQARRLAETISGAPLLRVFRPPYGAYDAATLAAAAQAGFPTVLLWDTSDRDTSHRGTVAEMLRAAEAATDGSVILMHCGPDATPYVLGPLLDDLAARGLQPVTVPTLLHLAWKSTAASLRPTVATILDGLSPLPPQSSGGPIVGPSGIGTMTFPPFAGPSGSATATSTPSGTPSPVPTVTLGPSPAASSSGTVAALVTALPAASAPPSPVSQSSPTADDRPLLVASLAIVLLALAIVIVGMVRLRRRPGSR